MESNKVFFSWLNWYWSHAARSTLLALRNLGRWVEHILWRCGKQPPGGWWSEISEAEKAEQKNTCFVWTNHWCSANELHMLVQINWTNHEGWFVGGFFVFGSFVSFVLLGLFWLPLNAWLETRRRVFWIVFWWSSKEGYRRIPRKRLRIVL